MCFILFVLDISKVFSVRFHPSIISATAAYGMLLSLYSMKIILKQKLEPNTNFT